MVENMREQARKKGKYTPKMEKSLGELEGMFDSLNSFGDNMNNTFEDIGKSVGKQLGGAKKRKSNMRWVI